MPWMADGVTDRESIALEGVGSIAPKDTELARTVAGLPWFSDDIADHEEYTLLALGGIASSDVALATMIANLPWFNDDITNYEENALSALGGIASSDVALATMIANLPWFNDDITEAERWAIGVLLPVADKDVELATMIANLPWFNDDIAEAERWAIDALKSITDKDAELANMATNLPWFNDDITYDELWAIDALKSITDKDAELATMIANLPWFNDDITKDERQTLEALNNIAGKEVELAKTTANLPRFTDDISQEEQRELSALGSIIHADAELESMVTNLPWFTNGITEDELGAIGDLINIADKDVELATMIANLHWFTNDITEDERWALNTFGHIASTDTELAKMLAATTWFTDGITEDEGWAIGALNNIAAKDVELAKTTASLPRFADGITEEELRELSALGSIIHADAELASMVTNLPWFTDGVTEEELRIINTLRRIAEIDTELALQLAASVNNQSRDLDSNTLDALSHIASRGDGALGRLTSQSWVADGLNDEESALVVVLGGLVGNSPNLYDELLQNHFIQTRTVSLNLARDVNIYVIQNSPFPSYEDLPRLMKESALIIEDFMGVPFPTTDIILHVVVGSIYELTHKGGVYLRSHMRIVRYGGDASWALPHETAHYYTHGSPGWFVEGMATFLDAYVGHRSGVPNHFSQRRAGSSAGIRSTCRYDDEPIENIRHYNYIVERIQTGDWRRVSQDDRFWVCRYPMGENLLFAVYDAIGEDAMSAAVRELYVESRDSGRPATEEDIYRAFLKHTPYDKKEAFLDVYQRLHGGAFAFEDVDFDDDHGDEAGLATEIAVGETAEGTLDYLFDFDYFTFPAEGGQRYRVNVDHESLRTSSVTMYSRDGTTRLGRRADTPESSTEVKSGVRVLWTARRDGTYFVAVQNFGGKTGSYTLTITAVDDDEDD